jgi:hypothetical protein
VDALNALPSRTDLLESANVCGHPYSSEIRSSWPRTSDRSAVVTGSDPVSDAPIAGGRCGCLAKLRAWNSRLSIMSD